MTPTNQLIAELHKNGMSQLAQVIDVYLIYASNTQIQAVNKALTNLGVKPQ